MQKLSGNGTFQHHKWVYFYLQDLFTLSKTKGMGPSKKVCVRVKRTLKVSPSGIPVRLGGRTEWPEKTGGSMAWWHGGSQRPKTGGKPHLRHLQGRRHSADRGRRVQGLQICSTIKRPTEEIFSYLGKTTKPVGFESLVPGK